MVEVYLLIISTTDPYVIIGCFNAGNRLISASIPITKNRSIYHKILRRTAPYLNNPGPTARGS